MFLLLEIGVDPSYAADGLCEFGTMNAKWMKNVQINVSFKSILATS